MATNGSFSQQDGYKSGTEQYPATSGPADASTRTASGIRDLSKDEVGWYFVEQYYTTLSKSPEKLHVCSQTPYNLIELTCISSSMGSVLSSSLVLKPTSPQFLLAEV